MVVASLAAACNSGPPPLAPEEVRAAAEAACQDAAAREEDLPPITDEASLDAAYLDFTGVDRDVYSRLSDLEPAEEVRPELEALAEGVRLVRFAAGRTLTAWKALDAEQLAEIRADVGRGSEMMTAAAAELDAPSCTPEAWDVAFVLEALDAAEAGVAGAEPTGVYRDDVDAACVRFTDRILRAFPARQSAPDQYLYLSRIETEAQHLGEFLERLEPVADLARVHTAVVDAADRLRRAANELARLTVGDGEGFEDARAELQAALEDVEAAFEALDLPCRGDGNAPAAVVPTATASATTPATTLATDVCATVNVDPQTQRCSPGPTPNGGAYSVATHLDDDLRPVARDEATRLSVTEYDADGNEVFHTTGTLGG